MTRLIDYENLSDDDVQYLADRPWLQQPDADFDVDDEFTDMSVPDLRKYAEDNGIDLAGARKRAEILSTVRAAVAEG